MPAIYEEIEFNQLNSTPMNGHYCPFRSTLILIIYCLFSNKVNIIMFNLIYLTFYIDYPISTMCIVINQVLIAHI